MDFVTKDRFYCSILKCEVSIAEHAKTATPWIHLRDSTGVNFAGLSVRTSNYDNSGVAHACEHLVGAGSRCYPDSHPFLQAMRHPDTLFLNNFTLPDHTLYCLLQKSGLPNVRILSAFLDGIFNPLLRQESFASEIVSENGQAGALLNEMCMKASDPRQIRQMELFSHLFPDSTFSYAFAGRPDAIRRLRNSDVTSFHASHYTLQNMFLFSSGEDDGRQFASVLMEHAGDPSLSGAETDSAPVAQAKTMALSKKVTSSLWPDGVGPDITMAWAIETGESGCRSADLAVFETAFMRGPRAPVRALLSGLNDYQGFRDPYGVMREIFRPIVAVSANAKVSVHTAKHFEADFADALCALQPEPLVVAAARRSQLDLALDLAPTKKDRSLSLFRQAALGHAAGRDVGDLINPMRNHARLEHIRRSPEELLTEMRGWFGATRSGVVFVGQEDAAASRAHPADLGRRFDDALISARLPNAQERPGLYPRPVIERCSVDSPCEVLLGFQCGQTNSADGLWIALATKALATLSRSVDLRQASYLLHNGLTSETKTLPDPSGAAELWSAWTWQVLPEDIEPALAVFSAQLSEIARADAKWFSSAVQLMARSLKRRLATAPQGLLETRSRAAMSQTAGLTEAATGLTALKELATLASQLRSDVAEAKIAEAHDTVARAFSRQALRLVTQADANRRAACERTLDNFAGQLSDGSPRAGVDQSNTPDFANHAFLRTKARASYLVMSYALPRHQRSLATAMDQMLIPDLRANGHLYDAKAAYCAQSHTVSISTVGDSRPERSLDMLRAHLTDQLATCAACLPPPSNQPGIAERLWRKFSDVPDSVSADHDAMIALVAEMRKNLPSIAYSAAAPNAALTELFGSPPEELYGG